MGNRRIMRRNFLRLVRRFRRTKFSDVYPSVPVFILENLVDELSDELKLSWHSSSRRIDNSYVVLKCRMCLYLEEISNL